MSAGEPPNTVRELCALISDGSISASSVLHRSLSRIARRDPDVKAWACTDSVVELARACDVASEEGGPLCGIPVGVKDVIDVAGFPTRCGTRSLAVAPADQDAAVIARLRAAGGVVIGKTETSPFAYCVPSRTRNPHRFDRSPGGSSSGSAAAVADGMVPLALGTQTGGSVIRPAAYCGIVGFKPTFGRYSLAGVQPLSPSADTLGLFGRHVDDVRFFDVCLSGRPASPQATTALPQRIAVPLPWMSTFMTAPAMTHLAAFAEHMRASGVEVVTDCDLEPITRVARNYCLFRSEISRFLPAWLKSRTVEVDPTTQRLIDCGFGVTADELAAAVADLLGAVSCCRGLLETVSLIVTAAATGEAPLFGIANDSNLLNRAWTMLHLPVVAVPFGTGSTGLPLGLQVIGRHGEDAAVLDAAEAIESIGRSRSAANHL